MPNDIPSANSIRAAINSRKINVDVEIFGTDRYAKLVALDILRRQFIEKSSRSFLDRTFANRIVAP